MEELVRCAGFVRPESAADWREVKQCAEPPAWINLETGDAFCGDHKAVIETLAVGPHRGFRPLGANET